MGATKTKKRKVTSAVTAVVVAAAIALTGTFAWQSISQEAMNEAAGIANPGGRLHDDFNGTNKDVYVENFTSTTDGQAIYARIRLDEYMETGMEAGENRGAADRKATPLVAGADINDETTWKTHIPGAADDPFHEYWTWTLGGQTTYMPTFNKNKDSLAADINGTYEGTTADDDTHYDDYVDYSDPANASKTANAVYDADDNDIDEGESAVEGTNIMTAEETHTAAQTLNGTVMTMQEWQAAGSQPGAYWVYDADGWAYWAQAIQPGTATGLLLDGIDMTKKPGQSWYYAVNVVAQFVTVDDWGADDNTGFYDASEGSAPTDDALALLSAISGKTSGIEVTAEYDATEVLKGGTLQFNAETTVLGQMAANQNVTWSVSGATATGTTISDAGVLTVAADEIATELTITAISADNPALAGTLTVAVRDLAAEINAITPSSTDTVTIDGVEFYVLAKETDQALLLTKDIQEERTFDADSTVWSGSDMQTYLNGDWLDSHTTLKAAAVSTTLKTRSTYNGTDFTETTDKVFLLSEADVFGTQNSATAQADDYTYNGTTLTAPGGSWIATNSGTVDWWWLRSPRRSAGNVAVVSYDGGRTNANYDRTGGGVRPALWVNLGS